MPRAIYDDHTRLNVNLVQPVIDAAVKYGASPARCRLPI